MTEKNYNPQQKEKKAMKKVKVAEKTKKPQEKVGKKPEEVKKPVEKIEEKKAEAKGSEKTKPKSKKKKEEAIVNSYSIPISTKKAAAICKFIKGKTIVDARNYLEQVAVGKKVIPMKGEIPHQKGKVMSGGFPKNASLQFITLLKSLAGNSNVNEIDNPIIAEAVANMASRPFGKFGRWRRKRTHIKLVAKEKMEKKKK